MRLVFYNLKIIDENIFILYKFGKTTYSIRFMMDWASLQRWDIW